MNIRHNPNDPKRTEMLKAIDVIVRRYAEGEPGGYVRRMKQVESFAIDRANGDMSKNTALKKQLMLETGGCCMGCGEKLGAASLQMHRLDRRYRHDEAKNCGYFRENVRLLCAECHQKADRGQ